MEAVVHLWGAVRRTQLKVAFSSIHCVKVIFNLQQELVCLSNGSNGNLEIKKLRKMQLYQGGLE